jgi:hypothetical protein
MTESKNTETRQIKEVLEELFKGPNAALTKYARVRKTKYEIDLWQSGMPITEVSPDAKKCFSKSFLKGTSIKLATPEQISNGRKDLGYAVSEGCHGRCTRLVKELNCALAKLGLQQISQIDKFLDWLTFSYEVKTDYDGRSVREQPGNFEVRIFHSEENRKEFWLELQVLLKQNRMMSMQDVVKIVLDKRKKSVKL